MGFLSLGKTGLALAPALRVLTWSFLALTLLLLGRGWYLELAGRRRGPNVWRRWSSMVLIASTLLAACLWGLRLSGLLGGQLF